MPEVHAQEAPSVLDLSVIPSGTGVSARCEFAGYEADSGYSMALYLNQVKEDGAVIEIALKAIFPPNGGAGVEVTADEPVEPGIYKATLVMDRTDGGTIQVDNFRNSRLYDVVKNGDSYVITPYQEPDEEPGQGEEQKPGEGSGAGSEQEPGGEPGQGNEQEPDEKPGAGSEQEPGEEPGAGSEQEPGEEPDAGKEQEPDENPGAGEEQEPSGDPEPEEPPQVKPQEPSGEEQFGSGQASCSHTTVSYRMIKKANPDQDAMLAGECDNCGEVLSYSFVPNTAFAAFLEDAVREIQSTQTGEAAIETERWVSFHQSVFDAIAMRPDVAVTVRYRYGGRRYEVTIPAGAEVSGLTDENGFCGFRCLDQVFGGRELVDSLINH